ncbi:DUF1707 SHOCT-like domain-containing protein [Streptomyces sp. YGL11-2]|uniref:DUF1707 SHOCT-like domain-containing protein n=1 Tax=Streptomyces sp. YGL11-2 TaxID=3414028 RepID=UPI003CF363D0
MDIAQPPQPAPGPPLARSAPPADAALRASDADRDRAADVLRAATADGRVSTGELDERLEMVYRARSKGDLATAVQDVQPVPWSVRTPAATRDVGVLGDVVRDGRWLVGEEYRAAAVIGSGVIDLRAARFTGPETTLHVNAWIGTVHIVVPEGVEVHVAGTGVVGGFTQDRDGTGLPATHRITVTGIAVCGSVHVVHELPPAVERRVHRRARKGTGSGGR